MNDHSEDTENSGRLSELTALVAAVEDTLNSIHGGGWSEGLTEGPKLAPTDGTDGMDSDPIGSLSSSGFGWATELFAPLQQAMDQLAGDPGAVQGFSQTWTDVGGQVSENGRALRDTVAQDGANWNSQAVTGYRGATDTESTAVENAGASFQGIATAAQQGAQAVDAVRQDVTVLVNEAATKAVPLLAQAMNPLTAAAAIAGLTALVAEYAPQITKLLGDLANVMNSLGSLIGQLLPIISQALGLITAIGTAMSSLIGGANGGSETPTDQSQTSEGENPTSEDDNQTSEDEDDDEASDDDDDETSDVDDESPASQKVPQESSV